MSIGYWILGASILLLHIVVVVGAWNRFMKYRRKQLGETDPNLLRPPSKAK
jgi:hypothetical protein